MILGAVLILAVVVLCTVAAVFGERRWPHFEKAAVAMQGIATTVAIMFAGYWYIYERKGQALANTELQVSGLKVAQDLVMIQARFTVHNLGATVLRVRDLDVRLLRIGPDALPLETIRRLDRRDFPDRIGGKDVYDRGLLMWPMIKQFRSSDERKIEPGESDPRFVDFISDCRHPALRIYVALLQPGSHISWMDQADVSLVKLCAAPVGSQETLGGGAAT